MTVEPWVCTRAEQELPEGDPSPERAAWAAAFNETHASSAGPISTATKLMSRFPELLRTVSYTHLRAHETSAHL
eukprot:4590573-Alexandrium_andersonii.AAC.1